MRNLTKLFGLLAALLVASLVVAACGPAATPTATPAKAPTVAAPTAAPAKTEAPKPEPTKPAAASPTAPPKALSPYKIAVILSLSGPFSGLGIPGRDAAVALANEINTAGGINGRKVELVIYDDATDETKAVLAIKRAIADDKVLAIYGPTGSSLSMAAVPLVEEAKVPMVVHASGDALVNPVKPWVFKFVAGEMKIVPELYSYFKSKNLTKIATLNPTTAVGKAGTAFIQGSIAKSGLDLVAQETYDPNDKDFAAQLTKIKASGAQGLIVYDASVSTGLIAKQAKQMGINIPWTGPYGLVAPAQVQVAGDAFDGLTLPTPKVFVGDLLPDTDPQKKEIQRFFSVIKKNTGKDADPTAATGWDAILTITEAIKKTSPDPDKVAEARAKIRDGIEGLKNFPASTSVLNLSPTDHEGFPPNWMVLVEIKGGKFGLAK